MSDIKVGDTVVCEKTNDFEQHITEGKKYIVLNKDEFDFKIYFAIERDDGVIGYYEASRFKKVAKEETKDSESTIKVGDTVVCVDILETAGLTLNKKYEVIKVYSDIIWVYDDKKQANWFFKKRFKKVEEVKDSESTIKAGDTVVCISQGNNGPGVVTVGKEYAVLDVNGGGIDFVNDQNEIDWFSLKNFKLVYKAPVQVYSAEEERVLFGITDQEQPATKPTGGLKYDSNKPPVDLVPREAIEAAARAFAFGARKYAAHNFKLGLQYSRLAGAVQRHLIAFMDNESLDPESGLSHLDHAMSALSMLVYMSQNKPEMDDRFNKQTLKLNNEK